MDVCVDQAGQNGRSAQLVRGEVGSRTDVRLDPFDAAAAYGDERVAKRSASTIDQRRRMNGDLSVRRRRNGRVLRGCREGDRESESDGS
jgi:hypothetical protein